MVVEPYRRRGTRKRGYACWPDLEGYSNCEVDTLDGLLTRDGLPRAAWFAHKGYAEITGQLVNVEISGSRITGIAGVDSDLQTGRLILGRRESIHSLSEKSVEVVFRNLDRVSSFLKDGEVFVRAERIRSEEHTSNSSHPRLSRMPSSA